MLNTARQCSLIIPLQYGSEMIVKGYSQEGDGWGHQKKKHVKKIKKEFRP
jgi:hypothetical protein